MTVGCCRFMSSDRDQSRSSYYPDIFCLCFALLVYFCDFVSDAIVTYNYFNDGEKYYGIATLLIIVLPSIVTTCVSYRMYSMDRESELSSVWNCKRKLQSLMLLLQLSPAHRTFNSLRYAWKSRKSENRPDQQKYYKKMRNEDADIVLLRVFKSFLESAPQQVLQLSFLMKVYYSETEKKGYTMPIISTSFSLLGMAFCLKTYQNAIRYVQDDKGIIDWKGDFFIFFWELFVTVSRIAMLSAIVYISWMYALMSMLAHWLLMTFFLTIFESHYFCTKTSSLRNGTRTHCEKVADFMFSSALGLVYIFAYITPGDGRTLIRHTCFYLLCLVENIIGAVIFYNYFETTWFTILTTGMFVVPYLLGCLCMIVYYCKFHPNMREGGLERMAIGRQVAFSTVNFTSV